MAEHITTKLSTDRWSFMLNQLSHLWQALPTFREIEANEIATQETYRPLPPITAQSVLTKTATELSTEEKATIVSDNHKMTQVLTEVDRLADTMGSVERESETPSLYDEKPTPLSYNVKSPDGTLPPSTDEELAKAIDAITLPFDETPDEETEETGKRGSYSEGIGATTDQPQTESITHFEASSDGKTTSDERTKAWDEPTDITEYSATDAWDNAFNEFADESDEEIEWETSFNENHTETFLSDDESTIDNFPEANDEWLKLDTEDDIDVFNNDADLIDNDLSLNEMDDQSQMGTERPESDWETALDNLTESSEELAETGTEAEEAEKAEEAEETEGAEAIHAFDVDTSLDDNEDPWNHLKNQQDHSSEILGKEETTTVEEHTVDPLQSSHTLYDQVINQGTLCLIKDYYTKREAIPREPIAFIKRYKGIPQPLIHQFFSEDDLEKILKEGSAICKNHRFYV